MRQWIENFFLRNFAGKLIARAAVTVAGIVAGSKVQGAAAAVGISISIDPTILEGALSTGALYLYELVKAKRAGKPAPPLSNFAPKGPVG